MYDGRLELAFYSPGINWSLAWAKNMLLFFDGVALLVSGPTAGERLARALHHRIPRSHQADRKMRKYGFDWKGGAEYEEVRKLVDAGLFHAIDPVAWIERPVLDHLSDAIWRMDRDGSLRQLKEAVPQLHEFDRLHSIKLLSAPTGRSRENGPYHLAYNVLRRHDLVRYSGIGDFVDIHPIAKTIVLILISQALPSVGRKYGLELYPTTDVPDAQVGLTNLLRHHSMPSASSVVSWDLQSVGIDVTDVPVDEVLDFKSAHCDDYLRYTRDVLNLVHELSHLPRELRDHTMEERRKVILEEAAQLKEAARRAWGLEALSSLGFSVAGAAWTITTGDPIGGALAFGAASAGPLRAGAKSAVSAAKKRGWWPKGANGHESQGSTDRLQMASAYSYLFRVPRWEDRWRDRMLSA